MGITATNCITCGKMHCANCATLRSRASYDPLPLGRRKDELQAGQGADVDIVISHNVTYAKAFGSSSNHKGVTYVNLCRAGRFRACRADCNRPRHCFYKVVSILKLLNKRAENHRRRGVSIHQHNCQHSAIAYTPREYHF